MRTLFLTHRLPYPPNRGDRIRAYQILRSLASWCDVDLLSLVHDDEEEAHGRDLEGIAASVTAVRVSRPRNLIVSALSLPTSRPLTHTMLSGPSLDREVRRLARNRPDVVLAYCSGMARLALEPALRAVPFVLDMVDVDSEKWAALAARSTLFRSWLYRREARSLARFEALAADSAVTSLVVTANERASLLALAPRARVDVISNGVDVAGLHAPDGPAGDPIVVFCGVMNYPPNEEGAVWMARRVWPLVRSARPDARLQLVGAQPTAMVRALADPAAHIEVTGSVPDVRPYLWRAAVAAAPLLTARGVQNKVLEAVAAGLPAVITPIVEGGLPPAVLPGCVTAAGPSAFADEVVALLNLTPAARRQRAAAADLTALSWEQQLEPLRAIIEDAARTARPHRTSSAS